MVIKYLALKVVEAEDELVSQQGGVVHARSDTEAWREYFDLKERERGEPSPSRHEIPPDMEGRYFL